MLRERVLHARGWLAPFFGWHNDEHHHSGLALFTPADVYFSRVEQVRSIRQAALDAMYAAHPERFVHGAPRVRLPPTEVSINPIVSPAVALDDDTTAFSTYPPNCDGAQGGSRAGAAGEHSEEPLMRPSTAASSRAPRKPPPEACIAT